MSSHAADYIELRELAEANKRLLAENQRLREWDEATWPLIGALAIYGQGASLPSLILKAKEIVAAREALAGDAE